jgi:phosphodiesterase/alkaline phosphatase D-like protein
MTVYDERMITNGVEILDVWEDTDDSVVVEDIHPAAVALEARLAQGLARVEQLPPALQAAHARRQRGLISRREFLRIVAAAIALTPGLGALTSHAQATSPTLPNGVAAGDTTQTSTVLWARSTQTGVITFVYATDRNFSAVVGTVSGTVSDSTLPLKVEIKDLTPGTQYFYRVTDAAGNSATGAFRTARPLQTNGIASRSGFRFGVSGDWRGELSPHPSIANASARNLELFVLHGDTIYADVPSPAVKNGDTEKNQAETLAEFRAKHAENYGTRFENNFWAALRSATSILATIDDHEVVNDFAGGATPASDPRFAAQAGRLISDTPLFTNGLQAFQEYNPIRDEFYGDTGDPRTAKRRKLYRFRTYGSDAAVFVLDTRSFRDQPVPPLTQFTPAAISQFIASTFTPGRTLLGKPQLEGLQRDLLQAQRDGVTWKFVLVAEPIQNLGPAGAPDRFEGYAAERTELLRFIRDNRIVNVVFIAADIHGTVINNVTYQEGPGLPQIAIGAFEVTTGPVAYDVPFGPTVVGLAREAGLITQQQKTAYDALDRQGKDAFVTQLLNQQITLLGYDSIGLQNAPLDVTLVRGGYVATHVYGWTEFDIEAQTGKLRVTTYGIEPYTRVQLEADPEAILSRAPEVVSEFVVTPQVLNRVFLPLL